MDINKSFGRVEEEEEELDYRLISSYFFPLYDFHKYSNSTWSFDLSLMHCNSIVPWECPFFLLLSLFIN